MNKLSFWHKLAFITNACWLAAWLLKYYTIISAGVLQSTILVNGLLLAYMVNIPLCLFTLFLYIRKQLPAVIPRWLLIINGLFFLMQTYLLLK
jgi:hypothetical protein